MCNIIIFVSRGCWKNFHFYFLNTFVRLSHFFVHCNSLYPLELSNHSDVMGVNNESHVITFTTNECYGQVTYRNLERNTVLGNEWEVSSAVIHTICGTSFHGFSIVTQELKLVYISHMGLEGNTAVSRGREALNAVIPTIHRTSLHSSSIVLQNSELVLTLVPNASDWVHNVLLVVHCHILVLYIPR